jgi:2-phosphosulfolactate phosphatase
MAYFDQEPFDVRCEWGMAGVRQISESDVVVIVDVMSFSTTVNIAVSRGATVFPYRYKDEAAVRYAHEREATLAGPREVDSQTISLSPASVLQAPENLRLVLPSPNGAELSFAAIGRNAVVLAGCLRNATAVAARAQACGKRITVVPAGERWPDGTLRPALEDLLGAGAIIRQLAGRLSPESAAAAAAFDNAFQELPNRISDCSSGRELIERGFGQDVELAAEFDVTDIVPVLVGEAYVRSEDSKSDCGNP